MMLRETKKSVRLENENFWHRKLEDSGRHFSKKGSSNDSSIRWGKIFQLWKKRVLNEVKHGATYTLEIT